MQFCLQLVRWRAIGIGEMRRRAVRGMATGMVLLVLLISLSSCDGMMESKVSTLERLRVTAGTDTGTVFGTVVLQERREGAPQCLSPTPCAPIANALVQLGIWQGPASTFRDSGVTFDRRVALGDTRFEIVAEAQTGADGTYRFPGLPKKASFVIRALAPERTGSGVGYFPSRFWLYESAEMELQIVVHEP
jgi:hypothetical protein